MNAAKYFLGVLAAVCFFALGAYFQYALPERNIREPASAGVSGRSSKSDPRVTDSFRACLDSKVKNGSVSLGKVVVEGRRWSIVSIPCVGEPARDLYEAVQPYSTEEYVRYRDKRRGVVRFFGRLYPPSQCVQLIGSSRGREQNEYSCSIRIDVDSEITEQLRI